MSRNADFNRFCERHPSLAKTILGFGKEKLSREDTEREARFSIQLSRVYRLMGEYDAAKLALQPVKSSPYPWVIAAKLDNLGRIFHDTFNFRAAHHAYIEGYGYTEQFEGIQRERRVASLEHNLSHLELTRTDRIRDLDFVQRGLFGALRIYNQLNDEEGYAYVCIHMAQLAREQGSLLGADEFVKEAIKIEEKLRNRPGLALAYQQSAQNALTQGESGLGIHLLRVANKVIQKVPACRRITADITFDLAAVLSEVEGIEIRAEQARMLTEQARALYEEMDLPPEFFERTFAQFEHS